jgi:hypothetical protein
VLVAFGVFVLVALPAAVAILFGGGDELPLDFAVFWLVAGMWNAYWWLSRMAFELRLESGDLMWIGGLRRGRVPVQDVIEVRPMSFAPRFILFVCRSGRPIVAFTGEGLQAFASDLARQRPGIPIRLVSGGPPSTELNAATGASGRRRFRWRHLLVFVPPIALLIYITTLWAPGHDPILGPTNKPFYVGTILRNGRLDLPNDAPQLDNPSDAILAATCRNYSDWLSDTTLTPTLLILEDPGLLRSAELLEGDFQGDRAALEAERLITEGLDRAAVLEEMRGDNSTASELATASRYLDSRNEPPALDAAERYVLYMADVTTKSTVIARLAIDPDREQRRKPISRTGDITVGLPDGTTVSVSESKCWR